MRGRTLKLLMLLTLIQVLSSCSPVETTADRLIKAPKLSGEFYQINRALKNLQGNNIVLKYPKFGSNNSPYVMSDIDGDGDDEVIVFYSSDDDSEVKFSVLDKVNDEWKIIFSTLKSGIDVDKVLVADILENKNNQIIVSWVKPNGTDRTLQIYNYEYGQIKCVYTKLYITDMFLLDINNDCKNELITIDKTLKITPNVETIMKVDNINKLSNGLYARLKPGSQKYEKITPGKISKEVNALFLDSIYDENDMFCTEIIVCNKNGSLVNLCYVKDKNYAENQLLIERTIRNKNIFCRDVDNDGIIEIPKNLSYRRYLRKTVKNLQPIVIWQKYNDVSWLISNLSIENIKDGYSFILPNHWYTFLHNDLLSNDDINKKDINMEVIAYYKEEENKLTFITNDQYEQEVLSIIVKKASDKIEKDYKEIIRKNNFVYYAKINYKNKNFSITLNDIKKYFSFQY